MEITFEQSELRPADFLPVEGLPVPSPLEDRLSALKYVHLQAIMRERGIRGTSIRDKRELVFRISDNMRAEQDEARIFDYEVEYGRTADNVG